MQGLQSILLLFPNEFYKFNDTGAQMLDSFYRIALNLLKNHFFSMKKLRFFYLFCNDIMYVITLQY